MRVRVRVLGRTVLSLTYEPSEADSQEGITGGSDLYTERDMDPPNPSGEEPWAPDNQFGF